MAKRKDEQPRCIFCGRFIRWADFPDNVVYHNFTSASDWEPREDDFAHKTCDEKDKAATRQRLERLRNTERPDAFRKGAAA